MTVTLVIPGRNAGRTIRPCLESVVRLRESGLLADILFVDDGSTDDTVEQVRELSVRCLKSDGQGPGAARNTGWRATDSSIIWFIDSDCVAEPEALELLLKHFDHPGVVAVGGSYGNMRPDSLVACLIHEEIVERHLAMPAEVDFLASFNVAFRREALEQVGGFDERFLRAQDAELAYRLRETGGRLRFDVRSRVKHFHAQQLFPYLKAQRLQGYWRMWLYFSHPSRAQGDSYSGLLDHAQPPLAMLIVALLPLLFHPLAAIVELALVAALLLMQLPMATRLARRTGQARYLWFIPFAALRAVWRGLGATQGTLSVLYRRFTRRSGKS